MPKKAAKKKAPAKPRKRVKTREGPISLYPLTFEEAVRGLLKVKMEPEELKGKKHSPHGTR